MSELFNESELRNLLERDEGQFLEFKSLWDLSGATKKTLDRWTVRDLIAECVAAFANADGGTLLLGVDDDGAASGHGYPEEAVAEFLAVPERRVPQLQSFFATHEVVTNSDYREIFDVTRRTPTHELGKLVEVGILIKEGERREVVYRPSSGMIRSSKL